MPQDPRNMSNLNINVARWHDEVVGGVDEFGAIPVTLSGDGNNNLTSLNTNNAIGDAFGRIRTSGVGNRFDVEFIYNKQADIVDEVTAGSGTATHDTDSRDVTLAVGDAANGSAAGLYSYDVPYTPGNSQLIDITGTLNFAALAEGEPFLFLRSSVTGSTVTTLYPQNEWTDNTQNNINWSYSQILSIDFQSLKVGRIRFFFSRNGVPVLTHRINNDNIRNTGFWQRPSLPAYWRIYNDDTYTYAEMGYGDTTNGVGLMLRFPVNANATMKAICGTVKSEGGLPLFDLPGFQRSANNGVTAKTVSTTLIPILSVRPAATFNSLVNRGLYIPTNYSIQANNDIRFALIFRPTLTNASWTAVDATNSGMEYDVSATALTGGTVEFSDYLAAVAGNSVSNENDGLLGRTLLKLGRTGTSDILTLAAIRTGGTNASVLSSLGWKEIR